MPDQLPPDPSEVPQGDVPPDALAVQDQPGPLPSAFIPSLVPVIGPPPMFQAPAPPPLPAPTANDPKQHLLAIAALGAMLGLGKQGGAGVGAGLLSAQAHMDADKKQQYNQALLLQQHQQAQAAAQYRQDELIYQRRAQAYLGAIDAIGKHAASGVIPTKAQYDLEIEGYATRLQQGGFRVSANQLRQQAPYIAPTAKKLMAEAVHEFLKNPANKNLIEQHPERLKDVLLPVDRDNDGFPEKVPLLQAAEVGGVPFSVDASGAVIEYPKGTTADEKANADGIFNDLIDKAKAEKKDITDPTLRTTLRVQAMKMAKEATAPERDPLLEKIRAQQLKDAQDKAAKEKTATTDLGQQLVDGDVVPSLLSKRAGYNEALAEANRISKEATGQPYSAVKAQLQYEAGKRFMLSLNSQTMVRFKGLGVSVVNTIDELKHLADQLQLGGSSFKNRAEMELALSALGDSEKGQLVARYLGAANTLKEEFANLVNGGMAPTEPAFALANKQINENYGVKNLSASLYEVQRLIKFRLNAPNELTPSFGGGANGGAPTPETPATRPYVSTDANAPVQPLRRP